MGYLNEWLKQQEKDMNQSLSNQICEVLKKDKRYHDVGMKLLQPQIDLHKELTELIKELSQS